MQTSSSPSSSLSSYPDSSITLQSLFTPSPSPHSSSSSSSSLQSHPSHSPSRCIGLNLLVKAIHHITIGSVVGVPYIQRRILTRRKRPLTFNNLIITSTQPKPKPKSKTKRQRRVNMKTPSKYRDSVLQPLTPKRRSERSEIKIFGK